MSEKKLFITAIVAGVLGVVFVLAYVANVDRGPDPIPILVTSRDISTGEVLDDESVEIDYTTSVPDGAMSGEDLALFRADAGLRARRPISAKSMVMMGDVQVGSAPELAAQLPNGMRAMSIPVTPETSVANLIRPGNMVEILVARKVSEIEASLLVESNGGGDDSLVRTIPGGPFEVLAVGDTFGEAPGARRRATYGTVTLLVKPSDARTILGLMAEFGSWDGMTLILVGDNG